MAWGSPFLPDLPGILIQRHFYCKDLATGQNNFNAVAETLGFCCQLWLHT